MQYIILKNLSIGTFLTGAFILLAIAPVQAASPTTKNHDVVCALNDFLATRIFINTKSGSASGPGVSVSKILEMPTQNAHGSNHQLFQTQLIDFKVSACIGCSNDVRALFTSAGIDDIINKLEVKNNKAVLTRGVDKNGIPQPFADVSEGLCQKNKN